MKGTIGLWLVGLILCYALTFAQECGKYFPNTCNEAVGCCCAEAKRCFIKRDITVDSYQKAKDMCKSLNASLPDFNLPHADTYLECKPLH
ncbi:hypothetical protein Avbf_14971 [Armadillidium vulgare]|nr:hypothetical protein Avbf_14971 [Armadillidium vulgare]